MHMWTLSSEQNWLPYSGKKSVFCERNVQLKHSELHNYT
jgi:hypothetical protein